MVSRALLAAAGSGGVRRVLATAPGTREVLRRFVAGETAEDALRAGDRLAGEGLLATYDMLGEDAGDRARADAATRGHLDLLARIGARGLGPRAEASLKLTALGQELDEDLALANARRICAAARDAGTAVTLDAEGPATVASTLRILRELRRDFPGTGAVVQAYLRRAEELCAELAFEGSRVRLCKGAYAAPEEVAFTGREDVDRSYVRCLKVLMTGAGHPMVATHDPRLIEIAGALARLHDRDADTFEYQLLYGVRPNEQRRLAAEGARVRVYVAYGTQWYGYFMRRLAERPAGLAAVLRSAATRG
ncbi:proline dehydrogenase family protein [Actinomadura parmotrematis]|uniref:proline dehydrogenase n=1 Tax=Actinomadura parmotrematis TaxID=2864039 RepID=A0ABS7FX64_9ACTN|nr:proline dehydrogenase family protein [Actinomadura parmotrematis]MBW8485015.1 proline dehydrogenase family protein [Actinomadura parmotrematis]